ncbi:DUF6082 family protein [Actinorugispora endophytica]|uniref:Uncharacterized protein n=1 Tax=Actinorugispora endophytica TaxID=1605990 RepID=A0A4R6V4J8_9ACTN|nr:DUF6082 family protein [Actinorugispora endophytica]TDQ53739.1 hypothetical protein EV190_103190 [Actinorugispora endophytica]
MRQRWVRPVFTASMVLLGVGAVTASLAVPVLLLWRTDDRTLDRWSQIGQAVSPVGVFFSGVAFLGIALTLFLQRRDLRNQQVQLDIAIEDQRRSSEISLRQIHTDLVKMAIDDEELLRVWPEISPGTSETRRDHYCNLVLNLQKVAYETRTIELDELRGALRHLMTSRDIHSFWAKAREARAAVTAGDEAEDFFTAEVDAAFAGARPPRPQALAAVLTDAVGRWRRERRSRRG